MKLQKYIYISLALIASSQIVGCNADTDDVSLSAPLTVEIGLEDSSRAPISGKYLPDGSTYGIVCLNNSNSSDKQIRQVKYSDYQSQIQGDPVILGDYQYTVAAFYPYDSSLANSFNDIGVELSALSQTDYLFGYASELNYKSSNAQITLKHALSMIKFNIRKDNFVTKDIKLLSLELDGVNTIGRFFPLTSSYSDSKPSETLKASFDSESLKTNEYITSDLMFVPTASGTATLKLNIDGKSTDKIDIKHNEWKMGYCYVYNITISAQSVVVEAAQITPWVNEADVNASSAQPAPGNAIDLGLSKLWADRNVGAYTTSGYGKYGSLQEHTDIIASFWGEDWAVPTDDDFAELFEKCTCTWTTDGLQVTGNGNTIILPPAGYILNGAVYNYKWGGAYLSASSVWEFSNTGSPFKASSNPLATYTLRPVKSK